MTYYKILQEDLTHHNFRYIEGLNIDRIKFNHSTDCSRGGLYFTEFKHLLEYLHFGELIANVSIPHKTKIYKEKKKLKANKLIISNIRPISEFEMWKDIEFCKKAFLHNKENYKYLKVKNVIFDEFMVYQDPFNIQFVTNPSNELIMDAVWNNGLVLEFINEQTDEICKTAVCDNGLALEFVNEQTNEICNLAIGENIEASQFVKS